VVKSSYLCGISSQELKQTLSDCDAGKRELEVFVPLLCLLPAPNTLKGPEQSSHVPAGLPSRPRHTGGGPTLEEGSSAAAQLCRQRMRESPGRVWEKPRKKERWRHYPSPFFHNTCP